MALSVIQEMALSVVQEVALSVVQEVALSVVQDFFLLIFLSTPSNPIFPDLVVTASVVLILAFVTALSGGVGGGGEGGRARRTLLV